MGILVLVLLVVIVLLGAMVYQGWSNFTNRQRLSGLSALFIAGIGLWMVGGAQSKRTLDERNQFLASTLEAKVVDVGYVTHRGSASAFIVVMTTEGNFEFPLGQVTMTGKSFLVKKAGSEKYELH